MKIAIHVNCRGYYSSRGTAAGGGHGHPNFGNLFSKLPPWDPVLCNTGRPPRPPLGWGLPEFLQRGSIRKFLVTSCWMVVHVTSCFIVGFIKLHIQRVSELSCKFLVTLRATEWLFIMTKFFIICINCIFHINCTFKGSLFMIFSQFKQLNGFSLWIGVSIQWLSCFTFKGTVFLNFLSPCEQLNGR